MNKARVSALITRKSRLQAVIDAVPQRENAQLWGQLIQQMSSDRAELVGAARPGLEQTVMERYNALSVNHPSARRFYDLLDLGD
jgi:hypothetical protein